MYYIGKYTDTLFWSLQVYQRLSNIDGKLLISGQLGVSVLFPICFLLVYEHSWNRPCSRWGRPGLTCWRQPGLQCCDDASRDYCSPRPDLAGEAAGKFRLHISPDCNGNGTAVHPATRWLPGSYLPCPERPHWGAQLVSRWKAVVPFPVTTVCKVTAKGIIAFFVLYH